MANGLGDFASLLGQAYSQSARQREDDYESNRKKAQRQQLLTMFAAPIVQGLGEGVVDFAGDLFLGDNAKNFFSTQEGLALQRRLTEARKPLEDLNLQRKTLIEAADGGDIYEGARILERQKKLSKLKSQYAPLGSSVAAEIDAAGSFLTKEEDTQVISEVDQLLEGIRQLEAVPTGEQAVSRLGVTKLSRTKPQKIFGAIARSVTGKDYDKEVKNPSLQFILTGGDASVLDSEWYKAITQDTDFSGRLKTFVTEAADVRPSFSRQDLINGLQEFKSKPENRQLFSRLDSQLERLVDTRHEEYVMEEAVTNSFVAGNAASQLRRNKMPVTRLNLNSAIAENIKGISPDAMDTTVDLFFSSAPYSRHVEAFRTALAKKEYNEPFVEISGQQKEAVDSFIKDQIKQGFTRFNSEVVFARDSLGGDLDFKNIDRKISSSGMMQLGLEYVDKMFTDHFPVKTERVHSDSIIQDIIRGKVEVPEGFVNDPQGELKGLVMDYFASSDKVIAKENAAIDSGVASRVEQRSASRGTMFDPNIRLAAGSDGKTFRDIVEEITSDLSKTKEERRALIQQEAAELRSSVLNSARTQGFSGVDPIFEEDIRTILEEFEEEDPFAGRFRSF